MLGEVGNNIKIFTRIFHMKNYARQLGAAALLVTLLLTCVSGCNVIGAFAQAMPDPPIAAAYSGLKDQTVGVMVWVDHGASIDYPMLQSEVAKGLTTKLSELTMPADKKTKPIPELMGIRYRDPLEIIKFQENHPELEGMPPKDLAVRLGVTRVIYIEITDFALHSPESPDVLKGLVAANVQVLEVTPGPHKVATIAYSDPNMDSNYPKEQSGVPYEDATPDKVYKKTVDVFTTDLVLKFFKHPSDYDKANG
jgi:hypothetical protein